MDLLPFSSISTSCCFFLIDGKVAGGSQSKSQVRDGNILTVNTSIPWGPLSQKRLGVTSDLWKHWGEIVFHLCPCHSLFAPLPCLGCPPPIEQPPLSTVCSLSLSPPFCAPSFLPSFSFLLLFLLSFSSIFWARGARWGGSGEAGCVQGGLAAGPVVRGHLSWPDHIGMMQKSFLNSPPYAGQTSREKGR